MPFWKMTVNRLMDSDFGLRGRVPRAPKAAEPLRPPWRGRGRGAWPDEDVPLEDEEEAPLEDVAGLPLLLLELTFRRGVTCSVR